MTQRFRSLWLSGIQLGSGTCRANELLRLLDDCHTDFLYLVGDTVDEDRNRERMPGVSRFPASDGELWLRFAELAGAGAQVIYLPGSTDKNTRRHDGQSVGQVDYRDVAVHTTLDGRKLLVTSGCEFDASLRRGTDLEPYSASAYAWLEQANSRFAALREALGKEFSPAAAGVRRRLARAREYMLRLENSLREFGTAQGYDGAVCGGLHAPVCRDDGAFLFASTGAWNDARMVLAEDCEGRLRLLAHDAGLTRRYAPPSNGEPAGKFSGDPAGSLAA